MASCFDELIERRHSTSAKWDNGDQPDLLPMWVADMDFQTAPSVRNALQRLALHGIFGYGHVPEAYFDAIRLWYQRRHDLAVSREEILFTTGVVPALSAVIRACCPTGGKVIVQTPVYHCFFSSIRNQGCEITPSPLTFMDGRYEMDFADLEEKAADPDCHLLVLCNPQNPTGRIWSREELTRLGDICLRHNVRVLTDEIHGDLCFPGTDYVPFASLGEPYRQNSVTCCSPSKGFNLAGLHVANIFVTDAELRQRIDKVINIHEVCEITPFAIDGLIAAYTGGEAWQDELREYIHGNYLRLKAFVDTELPAIKLIEMQATYLAWLDISATGLGCVQFCDRLQAEGGVRLSHGSEFGEAGEGFVRINLACPRSRLDTALERISRFIQQL